LNDPPMAMVVRPLVDVAVRLLSKQA